MFSTKGPANAEISRSLKYCRVCERRLSKRTANSTWSQAD